MYDLDKLSPQGRAIYLLGMQRGLQYAAEQPSLVLQGLETVELELIFAREPYKAEKTLNGANIPGI